jgi:carbamoyltransferase
MFILGISCFYHDAAAALIQDGELIAAVEEERISRVKHDSAFPINAIEFCLKRAGITADDIDYVVFYEKPHLKFDRIVSTAVHTTPFSWNAFRDGMLTWLGEKLWVKGLLKDRLSIKDPNRILFSEHHLSHAASAYYCSPYTESAILTVDAVGEWATATMGTGIGSQINLDRQLEFPHSLGLLYSTFTSFLGFAVNDGEYKVMGMAAFGQPRYLEKIQQVASVAEDGSLHLNMRYFDFHRSSTRMFNHRFQGLFGCPRTQEESETLDPYYSDIAASIQRFTENALVTTARHLRKTTGMSNLCMAGGVALNSIANYRILREAGFENIYIQPAASDAGGALGAALWAYHAVLNNPKHMTMEHAYYGPQFSDADIAGTLISGGISYEEAANTDSLIDRVVDALDQGKVVGWYQNQMEWGPRALGNRSILADPRSNEMKDIVNSKIKFREPFRPFAPSVVPNAVDQYFQITDAEEHYPSRFMLYVVPVVDNRRDKIPAVTNVDGTARIQVVHHDANPIYHHLISSFGQQTGVPVLLNTSFNLRGEPIANTPSDAIHTFDRSGLDLLVMDRFLVSKD